MNSKTLPWRKIIQIYFLLLMLVAGYSLYTGLTLLPTLGLAALQYRFPSVEGFLPISATVGLKHWLVNGEFDPIHPAGLTILLLAIISAILLRRGFCSHMCPIGTLSEYLYKARTYFFKTRLPLPLFLQYLLRLPKYLLLCFLLFAVFVKMTPQDIGLFIRSPYNSIAEVKMLYFFLEPSLLTLKVLAGLIALSLLIQNFWCRFLCPYGALLSLFTWFSPVSITRNSKACLSCHSCEKVCPSQLHIATAASVTSPECTLCQNCLKACPRSALEIHDGTAPVQPRHYSLSLIGLFFLGIVIATLSGHWNSTELPSHWVKYAPMAQMIFH